jgi:hypothetical protein
VDYRDVLATVVGASVAGIIAFAIRLIFPVNAAVLALIYAATYSLLWSIVGDHAKLLFHRYLPASTRLDGHWRLVTGSIALLAAASAGLIVAYAFSSRSSFSNSATSPTTARLITQTVKLQPRVVVNKKTIVMPVETTIVTTPVQASPAGAKTIFSRTVVVQRAPITVTVSSTEQARTMTVTQTTPAVTAPDTTASTDTTTAPSTTAPLAATDTVPTETAPAP